MSLQSYKHFLFLTALSTSSVFYGSTIPSALKEGYFVVQTGYYWSYQGKQQHLDIDGLIGDTFTVTDHGDGNGLVGFGYLFQALKRDWVELDFRPQRFFFRKSHQLPL